MAAGVNVIKHFLELANRQIR